MTVHRGERRSIYLRGNLLGERAAGNGRSGVIVQNPPDAVAVFLHLIPEAGEHAHDDAILRLDTVEGLLKSIVDFFWRSHHAAGGEDFEQETGLGSFSSHLVGARRIGFKIY